MSCLESERLLLRDFTTHDIENYISFYRDPCYCQFYPEQECTEAYQRVIAASLISENRQNPRMQYNWMIQTKSQDTSIGVLSLRLRSGQVGEIGCGIATDFQGKAYAQEAMTTAIEYAFDVLKLRYIAANTVTANNSAISLCINLGFKQKPDYAVQRYFRGRDWLEVELFLEYSMWYGKI